jgi:succinate dehydrogenase hydrophobic anchor subunit
MKDEDHPDSEAAPVSSKKPFICLAAPFVVLIPYCWLLLYYFPMRGAHPPHLTAEHLRVHWFSFWIFSYFPFSAICFIASLVMLTRQARTSSAARGALVLATLLSLGAVGFLAMILIFG